MQIDDDDFKTLIEQYKDLTNLINEKEFTSNRDKVKRLIEKYENENEFQTLIKKYEEFTKILNERVQKEKELIDTSEKLKMELDEQIKKIDRYEDEDLEEKNMNLRNELTDFQNQREFLDLVIDLKEKEKLVTEIKEKQKAIHGLQSKKTQIEKEIGTTGTESTFSRDEIGKKLEELKQKIKKKII